MKYDPKIIMWGVSLVFLAGGGWWSLQSVSSDVSEIKETVRAQSSDLQLHVISNGHAARGARMDSVERQQAVMGKDLKTLMTNQSAICQATNARCR